MSQRFRYGTGGSRRSNPGRSAIFAGLWLMGFAGATLPAPAQTVDLKAACKATVNCAMGTALSRLPLATPCNGANLCLFIREGGNKEIVESWFASGGACNAVASAAQGFNPQQLLLEALGCGATVAAGKDFQDVLCTLSPEAFLTDAVSWVGCSLPGEIVKIVGEIGQVAKTIGGEGETVYARGEKKVVVKSLGFTKAFKTSDGCGWITDCDVCSKTINVATAATPATDGRHCLWAWDGRVHKTDNGVVPLVRCAEGEPFQPKGRLDGRVVVVEETLISGDEDELLPPASLKANCGSLQNIALASIGLNRGEACSDTFTAPTVDLAKLNLPASLRSMIPAGVTRVELGVPAKPCREGMVCSNATRQRVKLSLIGLNLSFERDLDVGKCSELREPQESCGESFTVCRDGLACRRGRCVPLFTDYELAFKTGTNLGAGTDASIDVFLVGEDGSTEMIQVNRLIRGNAFERGNTDVVRLTGVKNVGKPTKIDINHHNIPGGVIRDPWTLATVVVRQGSQAFAADCNCTLNADRKILDLKPAPPR